LFKIGQRIKDKLLGTESGGQQVAVKVQVNSLIQQATDPANLAQMYKGWFPWW
jgi:phosphatidylinositol kinase/protein kinase (PI-3  family)